MQILFPDPMMARLRKLAEVEDRPVSELVRRAVERLLEQSPLDHRPKVAMAFPTFHGGKIKASASEMKKLIYAEDDV